MFTGIVEELGEVAGLSWRGQGAVLSVRGPVVAADARHGDSIAVNGVCLTVVETDGEVFTVDVMKESFDRSALGGLAVGDRVNLERAAKVGDRLGGHIVQGHVDGVATITAREPGDLWEVVRFSLPADLARYAVLKGSIAVDGISLTITEISAEHFAVSLIPTTLDITTLGRKGIGDRVNLEVDVIAKYVERLTAHTPAERSAVSEPSRDVEPHAGEAR